MKRLSEAVALQAEKVLSAGQVAACGGFRADLPVLVVLVAGRGTRFGQLPKCAQPVCGVPLARHSINAFREFCAGPVICVVGYRHEEVAAALGDDNIYVLTANPTGGTAFAAFETLSVPGIAAANPLLVITMGDRIVTSSVFRRLCETHLLGPRAADLSLLTAIYEPPKHRGKGRLVRDEQGRVLRIVEQRDIDAIADPRVRRALHDTTEGNCPLYAVRAATLERHLSTFSNHNAQGQYYLTDLVERLSREDGDIRSITTTISDPEYDLLCADVTRPMDLAMLEGILASAGHAGTAGATDVPQAVASISADRPAGQVASIAAQLTELLATAEREKLGFQGDQPVGIGISGGRVRVAFMHPDMGRFYGPAWQMPFGARDASGREQIVVLLQSSDDGLIQLFPTDPQFREKLNAVPADSACMYPGEDVADWYSYEVFGTRMAENLLLSLGFFSDAELESRRNKQLPLPPASLWVSNSMRRPFSLVGNAIASMRTLRAGNLGARVQSFLGRDRFRGLRVLSTGEIPQGGFSSSSAVTVATKNAINALYDLGIGSDMLVHLACQAEYGTGVRAGALDQATEQTGKLGQGTLISSNPRDNYRIIGTYPVPADRFHVLFAYSADRDRVAWQWSAGVYAEACEPGRLTAAEMRKMTGKTAEIAAILRRLPLETDFFQVVAQDLIQRGELSDDLRRWVWSQLQSLPIRITQRALRTRLVEHRQWFIEQLMETHRLTAGQGAEQADVTFNALLAGWRDPTLRRTAAAGRAVQETGLPLRAIVGYLFAEVAKNCYLLHHRDQWIEFVSRSQWGDRCFDIAPERLPSLAAMEADLDWEKGVAGPERMLRWLTRFAATPFDYNRGLDDASLSNLDHAPPLHLVEGTNFFRGLALIDLAEAMLKRAFGNDHLAVRVNGAGQGDYFQVHIDTTAVRVEPVKRFLRLAFYRRFGLAPPQDFVEPHPGGAAVGVRLGRFDQVAELIRTLEMRVESSCDANVRANST